MNRKLLTILLCAFVAAVAASYVVYRLVGKEVDGRTRGRARTVTVAVRDLDIGVLIKKEDLRTEQIYSDPPKSAVLTPDVVVGRGVISKIYMGEPVMLDRLALTGSGGGLAATIPPGMRACAVKVNEVVGVAGFVVPGMRVDVLISGTPRSSITSETQVKTLLQNIEVLSAGTNFQRDNEGKPVQVPVVNLLVSPEQAEVLSLASNETKIQLVLRNPLDRATSNSPGMEMSGLFGEKVKAKPVVKAIRTARIAQSPALPQVIATKAEPYTIQVMNGNKHSEQSFLKQEPSNDDRR